MATYNLAPSFSWTSAGINGSAPATTTPVSANATSLHPSSGSVPPVGAVLVSVDAVITNSFANLTAALASLPSDGSSQVIFMYPGTYTEQLSVTKGAVKIIGYQTGSVGKSYSTNEVTISFARGLSVVAPVAAGHTDAETAVIATASTNVAFYNINVSTSPFFFLCMALWLRNSRDWNTFNVPINSSTYKLYYFTIV